MATRTVAQNMQSVSERWSDVEGYEGLYQVSPEGQVRRLRKDPRVAPYRILKPVITQGKNRGYAQVTLSKGNVRTSHSVHRLVAKAYVDGDHNLSVDHIDNDRTNNNAANLRWVSLAENTLASWPRANGRSH